mmetsp:Transcript_70355/g.153303  ORF Transcript_70355/g.153303 Transcript_70355/m.153303 type:complete len:220 (-) Transcript_70355:895-1554(-)
MSSGCFILMEHMMALILPLTSPTLNFSLTFCRSLMRPENTEMSRMEVKFMRAQPINCPHAFPVPGTIFWELWTCTIMKEFCKAVQVPRKKKGSFLGAKVVHTSFSASVRHFTVAVWHLRPALASDREFLGTMNVRVLYSSFRCWATWSLNSRLQFSQANWKSKISSQFTTSPSMATSGTESFRFRFLCSSTSLVNFSLMANCMLASCLTILLKVLEPLP